MKKALLYPILAGLIVSSAACKDKETKEVVEVPAPAPEIIEEEVIIEEVIPVEEPEPVQVQKPKAKPAVAGRVGRGSGADYLSPDEIRYRQPNGPADFAAIKRMMANKPTEIDYMQGSSYSRPAYEEVIVEERVMTPGQLHSGFNIILARYVSPDGEVDYEALSGNRAALSNYLNLLARNEPARTASRNEQMAYWINLYNAGALDLIAENYPIQSVKELDQPFKAKRIRVGDRIYSLDQIENEIIRPRFREERVHFALNCGANSCPILRSEAYTPSNLDRQLEEQTRNFLRDSDAIRVEGNKVYVSRIFDWYDDDFGNAGEFIRRYRSDIPADSEIEYMEYDWSIDK